MQKYEESMKKYEGIILPIYGPWDLQKFRARPTRWRGGGCTFREVGERKNMKQYLKMTIFFWKNNPLLLAQ